MCRAGFDASRAEYGMNTKGLILDNDGRARDGSSREYLYFGFVFSVRWAFDSRVLIECVSHR